MTEQRYCVEVAHTGPDGQHYALQHESALIILDVMLPGADGFSVLRAIRAAQQTPVIMLTARARVDDLVTGLRAGADDYLVKPLSSIALLAPLQALSRRARERASLRERVLLSAYISV